MAAVAVVVPDLLFGSAVVAALQAAGHEVRLLSEPAQVSGPTDAVVLDLTADVPARLAAFAAAGIGPGVRTLAFYSHVEADVRAAALAAGIDLVVPRSRMARDGAALVARLLETPA